MKHINAADSREVGFFHNPEANYYLQKPPYSPDQAYPEYPFGEISGEKNPAYQSVRELFISLGYDQLNSGEKSWNPLKEVVKPGYRVVIKPNFVREKPYKGGDQDALITHGSIIRAILDYVMIALEGKGSVVIGDAPLQSSDWPKILEVAGINEMVAFYKDKTTVPIEVHDFRVEKADKTYGSFIWRYQVFGGAERWIPVDLATESALDAPEVPQQRLRAPNYDRKMMRERHHKGKHEYLINRHILEADAVLNLSKLKTHRIGGITCAMKNLVGILAHKSCLAHYSSGSIPEGGDEYGKPSLVKRIFYYLIEQEDNTRNILKRFIIFIPRTFFHFLARRTDRIFEGNWPKNDTLWRMIIDLNKIVLFADKKGKMQSEQQRGYWCLVDGIVAGEKNGPLFPTDKPLGVLIAGLNPVAVDYVCAKIMGFKVEVVPSLSKAFSCMLHSLTSFEQEEVQVVPKIKKLPNFHFIPHKNWLGKLEDQSNPKNKLDQDEEIDEDLQYR